MIKKTITYEDYNGKQNTEEFYFNLSETELTRMEMRETQILNDETIGGLNARLNAIVQSGSGRLILEIFEDLIKQSYGVRSEDGARFMKTDEAWEEFYSSGAYDKLFMELVTDADAAADFVNGIVPKSIAEGMDKERPKPQDRQKKKEKPSKISVVETTDDVETVWADKHEVGTPIESVVSDTTIETVEASEDSYRQANKELEDMVDGREEPLELTDEELELIRSQRNKD